MTDDSNEADAAKAARLKERRERATILGEGHLREVLGGYLKGKIERGERVPHDPEALRNEILSTAPKSVWDRKALQRFFKAPISVANDNDN